MRGASNPWKPRSDFEIIVRLFWRCCKRNIFVYKYVRLMVFRTAVRLKKDSWSNFKERSDNCIHSTRRQGAHTTQQKNLHHETKKNITNVNFIMSERIFKNLSYKLFFRDFLSNGTFWAQFWAPIAEIMLTSGTQDHKIPGQTFLNFI